MRALVLTVLGLGMAAGVSAQPVEIKVLAAGSLRAALGDVAKAFGAQQPGRELVFGFGASGLLKDRLLGGERADVFASANMEHPQALAAAGRAAAPQAFASNRLCVLGSARFDATPETLVARLLDPAVRVGTLTPKADVFVAYCTNAVVAQREEPALRRIDVPAELNVSASYGVSPLNGAPEEAKAFVQFLLSAAGQGVLDRHGFSAP